MTDIVEIARAHADRVDLSKIPCVSAWNAERAAALAADDPRPTPKRRRAARSEAPRPPGPEAGYGSADGAPCRPISCCCR